MYSTSNLLHVSRTELLDFVTAPNITLPVLLIVEALRDTHATEH